MSVEPHILVVDDDGEIRQLIGRFLREHGFRVTGVPDGAQMRETLDHAAVDLVVLDLMLPGVSGLDLCREVRARSMLPIIMLTARREETDRIVGLEVGADDYLPKPFNPRELLARIRAVLRRAGTRAEEGSAALRRRLVTFAGWTLDTHRRELTNAQGVVIDLSGGEYDLLLAFVEHPNRVLNREQLLDLARHRSSAQGFDRSIDVQISRLRRKLEGDPEAPPLIKTVRGAGYMFVPTVSRP
jgi:two-component system OmpR family response regulator